MPVLCLVLLTTYDVRLSPYDLRRTTSNNMDGWSGPFTVVYIFCITHLFLQCVLFLLRDDDDLLAFDLTYMMMCVYKKNLN